MWQWAEQRAGGRLDWIDVAVSSDGSAISAVTAGGTLELYFDNSWWEAETYNSLAAETWIC